MKAEEGIPACYRRAVVDTNVLLSAALAPHGVPAVLVDRLLLDGRLVFSAPTFAELENRIWKPKFDRYLSIERRQGLLREFSASAAWVKLPPAIATRRFSRDPNDDIFIQTALAAKVNRLISGDDDLLTLHPIADLHIVTPRSAWDEIVQNSSGTR